MTGSTTGFGIEVIKNKSGFNYDNDLVRSVLRSQPLSVSMGGSLSIQTKN